MENKINLVEILKDCPKGMELDCPLLDNMEFEELDFNFHNYPIVIRNSKTKAEIYLTEYGQFMNEENYKCIIFPKGKNTWEGFVPPCKFKEGDIVASRSGDYIFMLKEAHAYKDDDVYKVYNGTCYFGLSSSKFLLTKEDKWYFNRLATEEEKQKLFQAVKDNGYRWNAENKSLEKLAEPVFKMGNIVKNKDNRTIVIVRVTDEYYTYIDQKGEKGILYIKDQNNWELVPNKFDITTLKPFDKVLVRHDRENAWCSSLLSHMNDNSSSYCYKFVTIAGKSYPMCIPYEHNEHLLGTTDDCSEFYKTWK